MMDVTENTLNNAKEKDEEKESPQLLLKAGVLGGLLILSTFIFGNFYDEAAPLSDRSQDSFLPINPFEHVEIEAQAAYVYDTVHKKILYAKNEEAQLPLASLTKIMTALVAQEIISKEVLITIDEQAIEVDGDSGLHPGEKWRFKDLLDYTLVVSSNDGAYAIASAANAFVDESDSDTVRKRGIHEAFVSHMNDRASEIGLRQSYFINESGLDTNDTVGGGYGSARDISLLLSYIIKNKPSLLEATAHESLNFTSADAFLYSASNTNSALPRIPGLIASKTGFTDLAGGNLAVAYDIGINNPFIIVVLGSTFEGRFEDVEKLVAASILYVTQESSP